MRCSALPLATKCRGSYNLTKSHGSIQSRLGTAFHELAKAKVLKLALPTESVRVRYGITDDEMKDLDAGIYNIVLNIPDGARVIADNLKLTGVNGKLTGTPDLGIYQTKVLTIVDWKSGWGDVEGPETNNQMIGYAGMIVEMLEKENLPIERIDFLLVQTKLNNIKSFSMKLDELKERMTDIEQIINEAEKPDAEFTTGPWCNSCFKCFNCPAFAGEIKTLVKFIAPAEVKDLQHALQIALPFAKACGTVKNKIEALAKAWVDQNGDLQLGGGQSYERCISAKKEMDPEKAFDALKEFFTEKDIWTIYSASVTKLKELAATKKRGLSTVIINQLTELKAITEEPAVSYRIKKGEGEAND